MPRDFLAEDEIGEEPTGGRDFLQESQPESFGTAASLAPGRIGQDLYNTVYGAIQQIPGMYESAKTEIPGFLNPLNSHPIHRGLQALAGANEAVNNLAQAPLNLSRYGSERLHLLPQGITNAISKITPEDTSQAINQLFGEPKYAGESLMRGAARNLPGLIPLTKAGSLLNKSGAFATKKAIKNNLLNKHDELENRASDAFKLVSDEVNDRGINKIHGIHENQINDLKQYFPVTRASVNLINDAKSGDYNALRKVQTDLYSRAKKNLGSDFESDRLKGAEMLEKRNDINDMISNHLKNTGNHDLNELLNLARNDWSTLQNTYYNENMSNSLINMFNKKFRKTPKNLINLLSEESLPIKNLLDFHPGLDKKLGGYKVQQNVLKILKNYGLPVGTALGGYEYAKSNH